MSTFSEKIHVQKIFPASPFRFWALIAKPAWDHGKYKATVHPNKTFAVFFSTQPADGGSLARTHTPGKRSYRKG